MKFKFLSRNRVLSFFVLIFASILITKLFWVQVVHRDSYSSRADRQYSTSTTDIYERGSIYFSERGGELVSAAGQIAGFKLAIVPEKIEKAEETFEKLSKIVKFDKEEFITKAEK